MSPVDFPEADTEFQKPRDLTASQCGSVCAFTGSIEGGNLDGCPVIVTAWKPTPEELEALNAGGSVFLSMLSSTLPPHMLTTSFNAATMKE